MFYEWNPRVPNAVFDVDFRKIWVYGSDKWRKEFEMVQARDKVNYFKMTELTPSRKRFIKYSRKSEKKSEWTNSLDELPLLAISVICALVPVISSKTVHPVSQRERALLPIKGKRDASESLNVRNARESGYLATHGATWGRNASNAESMSTRLSR